MIETRLTMIYEDVSIVQSDHKPTYNCVGIPVGTSNEATKYPIFRGSPPLTLLRLSENGILKVFWFLMSFPVENGHVGLFWGQTHTHILHNLFWPLPRQPAPGRFEEASR